MKGHKCKLKIEKFEDISVTGGMHSYPQSYKCKFFNLSLLFFILFLLVTAFRIIPECQNNSGIQINIRMMRYDTFIIRTFRVFSGY